MQSNRKYVEVSMHRSLIVGAGLVAVLGSVVAVAAVIPKGARPEPNNVSSVWSKYMSLTAHATSERTVWCPRTRNPDACAAEFTAFEERIDREGIQWVDDALAVSDPEDPTKEERVVKQMKAAFLLESMNLAILRSRHGP